MSLEKRTIQEEVNKAIAVGTVIDNSDTRAVVAYIMDFCPEKRFKIDINFKEGKTLIIGI